jgi:CHAT domain-containing protein
MAGLRGRVRHDESGPELLAVGDPSLESTASRLQRAGFPALSPLPGTRTEVEAIAGLWGSRARVLVGAAATEEAVKAVPRSTRFLHLATHGVLSQHAPLDSGLVLAAAATPAAPDNGLLQAWEVLERLGSMPISWCSRGARPPRATRWLERG